jgi:flagellum-specific peptidoglycan hydrolase FlgJ
MRKAFSIILFIALLSADASSTLTIKEPYTTQGYIETFKSLAIIEMNRSGIPASITLAQAILESAHGNSELAVYANNHFGIKNKSDWKGAVYLKGGCYYKKYNSVLESYKDHSRHLKTRSWYADLFKLEVTDYSGWAYGLKKGGYAEDPVYAEKLIKIIEDYQFDYLDSY